MTERIVLPIHGQDHCPGGPDPIPCLSGPVSFRAVQESLSGAFLTVNSGSTVTMEWEHWHNDDTSVFQEFTASSRLWKLRLLQAGLYVMNAYVEWADLSNTDSRAIAVFTHTLWDWDNWQPGASGVQSGASTLSKNVVVTQGTIEDQSFLEVELRVTQNSGSPENLAGAQSFWDIVYFPVRNPVYLDDFGVDQTP